MRINQPVTQREVVLSETDLIVSKTDLKGQITYINQDFVRISGFNEAELIGQPHNLVRHPDMPQEAFADLWRDLKAGRPWIGMVKNRCKNGDYYWVLATASPLHENDQIVGYLSVRRKPTAAQVEAAEAAYRMFREKRAGGMQIRHGAVVQGGEGFFAHWSLKSKLLAGFASVLLATALIALLGIWGMSQTNHAVDDLYQAKLLPSQELAKVGRMLADSRAQVLLSLQHNPAGGYAHLHDHPVGYHLDQIAKNEAEVARLYASFANRVAGGDIAPEQLSAFQTAYQQLVSEGFQPARQALAAGAFDEANLILLNKINPMLGALLKQSDALDSTLEQAGAKAFATSSERFSQERWAIILIALAALVSGLIIALRIVASVTGPLADVLATFRALANGDFTRNVDLSRNDELGEVLQGLQSMQIQQGFSVAEANKLANDNLRIRIALDCVSANLRIADDDGLVLYANRGLLTTLRQIEPGLRAQQPGFTVDGFVGSNIGSFYQDPAAALQTLRELKSTRTTELDIGGRIYNVVTNPIVNERGERLGTVGEWVDRTAELNAQRSVASLISRASAGDLAARMDTSTLEGFYRELGGGINQLLTTTAEAINEIGALLARIAQGDLTRLVETEYQGTFGQLRDDANRTVSHLRELVQGIQMSAETINTAAKEIAVGNQDLSGRTEEQASSLEETASSMEQLTGTVRQNADNARQANELAVQAQGVAERGGAVVAEVVRTMSEINQASGKIADIIGVIDGIAFQTNILALNAAVEAARAGEQGRGFAVVATEVRNLAQRSAAAAKEIKGLISDSVDKVEAGNRQVDQAGRTMEEVVSSIKRVARIVTDIAEASIEQSTGIDQIGQAVTQMDEVTQQNAALVEEAAAAAESLEEQSEQMARAVSVFRTSQGVAAQPAAPALPSSSQRAVARPGNARPALPAAVDDEWAEF